VPTSRASSDRGRDPKSCKVFYLIAPLIAETAEEAQLARRRERAGVEELDVAFARLGWITNIDFSKLDLDAPVGELSTNGHQESLAQFLKGAGSRTLREAMIAYSTSGQSVDLIGTPDQLPARDRGRLAGLRRRRADPVAAWTGRGGLVDHRRPRSRLAATRPDPQRVRPSASA
jgi:alkanesulfonate monooxygenase SsuD/methylene tetrahydromethanopterin reductase-like flavin-dependent oxidoreductase (luciferase family)